MRWDKLLERRDITPERLLTEYFQDLYGLQGDNKAASAGVRKRTIDGWVNFEEKFADNETQRVSTLRISSKR